MKRFTIRLDKKLAARSMPGDPRACVLATGIKEQYGADEVFVAGTGGWIKNGRKTYRLKHTLKSRIIMSRFDLSDLRSTPKSVDMKIVNPVARNAKAAAGTVGVTAGAVMAADGLWWAFILAFLGAIAAIVGLAVRQNKGHGKVKMTPHHSMPGHLIDATGETLFAQAKRKRATPRTAAAPSPRQGHRRHLARPCAGPGARLRPSPCPSAGAGGPGRT